MDNFGSPSVAWKVRGAYHECVRRLLALTLFSATVVHAAHVRADSSDSVLPVAEERRLQAWYDAVGSPRVDESFGALVARAGAVEIGKPYRDAPEPNGPETLRISLATFQCVSFVESSLAVARCAYEGTPSPQCFVSEIESLRYRGGVLRGAASRLHYFNEWLSDNAARNHLRELTPTLGGAAQSLRFDFVTTHRARYPFLGDQRVLAAFLEIEARLSATPLVTLNRAALRRAQGDLQPGDVVAIVSDLPGSWISHTGLVVRDRDGRAQLLHASKPERRVVLSKGDIANYVESSPVRRGLVVFRPVTE